MKTLKSKLIEPQFLIIYALLAFLAVFQVTNLSADGLYGRWFQEHPAIKILFIFIAMSHLTITAMSLCFHRAQTHQAVKFHPLLDRAMQTLLWMVTSMSKLDWVSVHIYHHAHSDTELDPHSPKHKGLFHVFLLGAFDYSKAKSWPEVLKIRNRLKTDSYEKFIANNLFLGPIVLSGLMVLAFGPFYGILISLLNFSISPLFAVGGVNALAHYIGYQNYESKDNSRNLGFLVFLNWIICGELDHNNHHKFPKSPSFAHRWFEVDFGWGYIVLLRFFGMAKVLTTVPKFEKSEIAFVRESKLI